MKVINLRLEGLKLILPSVFQDERGFFKETYQLHRYSLLGIDSPFVQDNHSFSKKDVIRGMHFQAKPGQNKLVWASQGRIFDVVVDLRKESPSFGEWEGVYLDSQSHEQLFVPIGFAHGFCVVSESGAHVNYKVSTPYEALTEKTFRYDDPTVGIQWPTKQPIVSARDLEGPYFEGLVK